MNPDDDNMKLPAVQITDDSNDDVSTAAGQTTAPVQPDNQTPLQQQPQQVQQPGGPQPMPQFADDGMDADDVDLIEKSWVEKAKNIVSETMGNPHSQSVEITKMKADYIKKRYNKELKGNE